MEQIELTFEDYIKILIHLEDKNTAYQQQFMIADCNPSDIENNYMLEDEVVEERIKQWSEALNVESKWNETIDGHSLRGLDELTVETWMTIVGYMKMGDSQFQAYIPILHLLFKDKLSLDEVKQMNHRECMENISFFLHNWMNYMASTKLYFHLLKTMGKKEMKKIQEKLSQLLNQQN